MKEEKYERTELEVIRFQTGDVITTSPVFEEDEVSEIIRVITSRCPISFRKADTRSF